MTTQEPELTEISQEEADTSEGIVGGLLVWVAVRCTLQYVILPFILPLIGVGNSVSAWLSVAVSLFALGMMVFNIRRLWATPWRWRYLGLSAIASTVILIFIYLDISELLSVSAN